MPKYLARSKTFAPESLSSAPSSPLTGQIYFDSTLTSMRYWNGSDWLTWGTSILQPWPSYFEAGAFIADGWGLGFTVGVTINGFYDATDSGWVIQDTTAGIENLTWIDACISENGQHIYLLQSNYHLWASHDSGETWTDLNHSSIAAVTVEVCTNDGSVVWLSPGGSAGLVYKSTDSGATFDGGNSAGSYAFQVQGSFDGTKLITGGGQYYSTNSGSSWSAATTPTLSNYSSCISKDGTHAYTGSTSTIYVSTNLSTYSNLAGSPNISGSSWTAIACSATGQYVVANTAYSGVQTHVSADYGVTWTHVTSLDGLSVANINNGSGKGLSVSNDGRIMVIAGYAGTTKIAVSFNYGVTWTTQSPGGTSTWGWDVGLISGDSTTLIGIPAVGYAGGSATVYPYTRIFVAETPFNPGTITVQGVGGVDPTSVMILSGDSLRFDGPIAIVDGDDISFGSSSGSKLGTATSQKLGFWNVTPIVQPAASAQASSASPTQDTLTDSTGGTANTTLVDVTTIGVSDPAKVNDNFADVAAQLGKIKADNIATRTLLEAIRTALVNSGLMKGSA